MVWYSHLFQNFPEFVVIHTVKGFAVVNKAKVEYFFALFPYKTLEIFRVREGSLRLGLELGIDFTGKQRKMLAWI